MKALLGALTKSKGQAALDHATSLYTEGWGAKPSQQTVKMTVVEIETDYMFLVPTQEALYLHASNAKYSLTDFQCISEGFYISGFLLLIIRSTRIYEKSIDLY